MPILRNLQSVTVMTKYRIDPESKTPRADITLTSRRCLTVWAGCPSGVTPSSCAAGQVICSCHEFSMQYTMSKPQKSVRTEPHY